jgi:hypothetical protein
MAIYPPAGAGRDTGATPTPTHIDRQRPPTLSPEAMKELEGLALAIRDHAFDPKMLRDFATMVLCSNDALSSGPGSDAARTALNDLIRPFPEPPAETPFKPTEKLPRVPLDLFRDVWRAALAGPHGTAWGDDRIGKTLEGLGIEPSAESLRMQQTQRALRLLWRQEVSEPGSANASHRIEPPRLLLRLAAVYCRAHPDVTHKDFLQPFRTLAEYRIPLFGREADSSVFWDSLCKGLYSGLVPYERFRALVEICTRALRPTADALGERTSGLYCYVILNALFSPVALRLLEQGRETLDTLISLLGIDAWTQTNSVPSQRLCPSRIAFLLSALGNCNVCGDGDMSVIGDIENPHALLALAKAGVPFGPVKDVLKLVGKVDWHVLEAEISRVVAVYKKERRFLNAQSDLLPYARLKAAERHGQLNRWVISRNTSGSRADPLIQTFHPASALLDSWRAQGMDPDTQFWMSHFLIQGFPESWALAVLSQGIDIERVEAWFASESPDDDHDLSAFLDDAMKETVARLLTDSSIDAEQLKLAPALIACGLDAHQLERALRIETGAWPLPDLLVADLAGRPGDTPLSPSPLRRIALDTLAHLRRSLIRLRTVQAALPPDGPEHARCETLAGAWDDAIQTLDQLLKSSMEHQEPAHLKECLQGLRDRLASTAYPADRRVHIAKIRG